MASPTSSLPHIATGIYEYERAHFTDMLATLSEVSEGELTFSIGCDFHLSAPNLQEAMDDPQRFAIGDTQLHNDGVRPLRNSVQCG